MAITKFISSRLNGHGDLNDTKGLYVSMWKNYLSKSPLIQRYLKETSQDQ